MGSFLASVLPTVFCGVRREQMPDSFLGLMFVSCNCCSPQFVDTTDLSGDNTDEDWGLIAGASMSHDV